MTQHTQGRLTLELVESDSGTIRHLCPVDKDRLSVLTVVEHEGVKFAAVYLDDDARRLVAAWNAFDGVPTDDIEKLDARGLALVGGFIDQLSAQRDELLAALTHIEGAALDLTVSRHAISMAAYAAIAKVEA